VSDVIETWSRAKRPDATPGQVQTQMELQESATFGIVTEAASRRTEVTRKVARWARIELPCGMLSYALLCFCSARCMVLGVCFLASTRRSVIDAHDGRSLSDCGDGEMAG